MSLLKPWVSLQWLETASLPSFSPLLVREKTFQSSLVPSEMDKITQSHPPSSPISCLMQNQTFPFPTFWMELCCCLSCLNDGSTRSFTLGGKKVNTPKQTQVCPCRDSLPSQWAQTWVSRGVIDSYASSVHKSAKTHFCDSDSSHLT